MSNESLKRVFQKLLNLKGKDGKPGHIMCLVSEDSPENLNEEQNNKSLNPKIFNESYKKPLFAVGGRKRRRSVLKCSISMENIDLDEGYIQEKKRERYFASLATKGVVQLFNAISSHQIKVKSDLEEAGKSETKREKAIASTSKGNFIQRLNKKPAKKTYVIEASV